MSIIEGMDIIPIEVYEKNKPLFRSYLLGPGLITTT